MALNKTIILKVRAKTEKEPEIGDFLVKLLEFESGSPGWWSKQYVSILENACKEAKNNASNRY
jgi:hypothetical protein